MLLPLTDTLTGVTVPLVVTQSGEKLGKTSGNAVWLERSLEGSVSIRQYLEGLSFVDLMTLAHQLTSHPTEMLKVRWRQLCGRVVLPLCVGSSIVSKRGKICFYSVREETDGVCKKCVITMR